jgi:ABC-type glycerol-3-phosphate transport system substrate-binding protein
MLYNVYNKNITEVEDVKKRILFTVLLCAAVIFQTACQSGAKDAGTSNTGTTADILADEGETTTPEPVFLAKDMGGKQFHVITAGWWDSVTMLVSDIFIEEYNGEPLNDAAYNRKIAVEEKFNCKIIQSGQSYGPDDDNKAVMNSVSAGDATYDVAMIRGINFTQMLVGNYLLELDNLQNIDFESPWWRKNCSDALRLGGKRFGISGNLSTVEISLAAAIMFNKDIVEDFNLDKPYELVENGRWTIDKFAQMCRDITHDLDGDGAITGQDMWGNAYDRDRVWNLLNSCGVKMMEVDADGYPRIVIDQGDNLSKTQNILSLLFDESYSANSRRIATDFTASKVLFAMTWANGIAASRSYEVDFGIIPFPKYNEDQQTYLSNVYGLGIPIICVPTTNLDMENTGLFMDYFSYEGRKNVIPVFYDNILKTKAARDSQSEEMLDYIFDNIQYDTGTLLNFSNFTQEICAMAESLDTNIASLVEKRKANCENEIKRIMDAVDAGM